MSHNSLGGPLYFIFHIQTKCYYFQQTLLAGGAMYRPTGRGFVIRHSPFDENFRFFATSHIYLGFELAVALVILGNASAYSMINIVIFDAITLLN